MKTSSSTPENEIKISKEAEQKISNIESPTNLLGFHQFNSKEDAILIINKNQNYMNDDGTFKRNRYHANCDPYYQELSAAIDYYKFEVKRSPSV